MTRQDVIDLIDAHVRNNDAAFKKVAYKIAKDFYDSGNKDLSNYIISQITPSLQMTGQSSNFDKGFSSFFKEISPSTDKYILPDLLSDNLKGIVNAVSKNVGLNKFLFVGSPGTGKTEAVRQLGRILHRRIFMVNFESIIDSRMGETAKNIDFLFEEINNFSMPQNCIFLFDEIDSIALDRINKNDIREMGRATSTLLHCLDYLSDRIMLVATTNLQKHLDQALKRRFDAIINFDQYSTSDLVEIANSFIDSISFEKDQVRKNNRLLEKLIDLSPEKMTPGRVKSLLRTSIAFSNGDKYDYLRRFYIQVWNEIREGKDEIRMLRDKGFSLREIETLTGISKSEVERRVNNNEQ